MGLFTILGNFWSCRFWGKHSEASKATLQSSSSRQDLRQLQTPLTQAGWYQPGSSQPLSAGAGAVHASVLAQSGLVAVGHSTAEAPRSRATTPGPFEKTQTPSLVGSMSDKAIGSRRPYSDINAAEPEPMDCSEATDNHQYTSSTNISHTSRTIASYADALVIGGKGAYDSPLHGVNAAGPAGSEFTALQSINQWRQNTEAGSQGSWLPAVGAVTGSSRSGSSAPQEQLPGAAPPAASASVSKRRKQSPEGLRPAAADASIRELQQQNGRLAQRCADLEGRLRAQEAKMQAEKRRMEQQVICLAGSQYIIHPITLSCFSLMNQSCFLLLAVRAVARGPASANPEMQPSGRTPGGSRKAAKRSGKGTESTGEGSGLSSIQRLSSKLYQAICCCRAFCCICSANEHNLSPFGAKFSSKR